MVRLSAKSRFTAIMVLTASIAMLLVGVLAWVEGEKSLREAEFTHLESVRVAKSRLTEDYFSRVQTQIIELSQDQVIVEAMKRFDAGFTDLQQSADPAKYEADIEAFYEDQFIPKLAANIIEGTPDFGQFAPRNAAASYLQYHYMTNKPADANAEGRYSYTKAPDGSAYSEAHSRYHNKFRDFLVRYGYYDVFLVTPDTGDVIYSVAKEVDFATSLVDGPYKNTGLADVTRAVMKNPLKNKTHIVDFQSYAPSYNVPASFIATPIYDGRDVIGILVFQMPIDKIQNIMTSNREWREEGLGESGETYIIGEDYSMRSDSRFLLETPERYFSMIRNMGIDENTIALIEKLGTTILLQPVKTRGAEAAIKGQKGHFVSEDYRGVRVLSAYDKLDIEGLNWGIVSEIDEAESFSPISRLLKRILISTAIFIPIVAYLSFWLSQSFMTPVRNLIDIASKMRKSYAANDHDAADLLRFETKGASEYQELSNEMNGILDKAREDMIETRRQKDEYTNLITTALPSVVAEEFRLGERNIFHSTKQASAMLVYLDNFNFDTQRDNFRQILDLQEVLDSQVHKLAIENGIDLFNQIGMEYVGICGLTTPFINHVQRCMSFAARVIDAVKEFNDSYNTDVQVRIGLDIGALFGGLQVDTVLDYDVHGDPVVIAQKLGYDGDVDCVTLSDDALKYTKSIDLNIKAKKAAFSVDIDGKARPAWSVPVNALQKIG